MKILVLGAGGTGGYFGGRLAQAGNNVTFLVRERRAAQLAEHGLVIETTKDRMALAVRTVTAGTIEPAYDAVLLSCKAYDLGASIDSLRPAMRDDTVIVPLLNGMSHLADLDAVFGKARVLGGSCAIAATLTKEGVVKNLSDIQSIVWGPRDDSQLQRERTEQLARCFARTSVDHRISANILQDMWEKIVFLSTLAGMTCLMRGSVGEIIATAEGVAAVERCLASCIAVAEAEGFAPREQATLRYWKALRTPGSPITASMLRDLEGGGAVEADHIVGFMLAKAREHGIDDTLLAVAYAHLKTYENRRAAGRL